MLRLSAAGHGRGGRLLLRPPRETTDGGFDVVIDLEDELQLQHGEQVMASRRDTREAHRATLLCHALRFGNQHADTGAVDIGDVREIDDDFLLARSDHLVDVAPKRKVAVVDGDFASQGEHRDIAVELFGDLQFRWGGHRAGWRSILAPMLRSPSQIRNGYCGFLFAAVTLCSAAAPGCTAREDWGTPDYYERIVGVKLAPAAPPVTCTDDSVPGVLAFRVVQLPPAFGDALRARSNALQGLPHQLPSERERKVQPWTHGALSDEARQAFELAITGAATAIEHSSCRTMKSEQVMQQIRSVLAKDSTWYSYEFKAADGKVTTDQLLFRVLDPVGRVLYELVNFS
jgi:hypothetical protein